jgi:hypothetical protein
MKIRTVYTIFVCLALLTAVTFAAAHEYQTARVIKVERQESQSQPGGSDAPTQTMVARHHVSIQIGDKVYRCSYDTHSDNDISWIEGKEVEARVSGKVLYVKKPNGKEEKGTILGTSSVVNP